MEIISLESPRPRSHARRGANWEFPAAGVVRPGPVLQRKLGRLELILETRQSRRDFRAPLTLQQLGDLLWHSYRVRQMARLENDLVWESRPAPAGGGCYPIQVLGVRVATLPNSVLAYYPEHHLFGVRDLISDGIFERCVAEVGRCLKTDRGTILWFVADLGRSGKKYHNPESLAWRDSGALLATLGLVAEGMGLNFCGLGLHEIPSLRRFLKLEVWTIGVGGCVISGR